MKALKSLILFGMVRRGTVGLLAMLMLVMAVSGKSQGGNGTLKWV